MRFHLVDRFINLEPGRSATAIKAVSLADDCTLDYQPGMAVFPATMLLEAMAQTGGLLIIVSIDFAGLPVLAKVQDFRSIHPVRPGDRIIIEARIDSMSRDGCRLSIEAVVDGNCVAQAKVILAITAPEEPVEDFRARVRRRMLEIHPEAIR